MTSCDVSAERIVVSDFQDELSGRRIDIRGINISVDVAVKRDDLCQLITESDDSSHLGDPTNLMHADHGAGGNLLRKSLNSPVSAVGDAPINVDPLSHAPPQKML